MATGARSYLDDGHALVSSVMRATGWPNKDSNEWHGLGRRGVLEEYCDHSGQCSQDGQTFKGIFMLHLSEFCRPLWPHEEEMVEGLLVRRANAETEHGSEKADIQNSDEEAYKFHLERCDAYGKWIEHNAEAVLATRDKHGLFGMWWTSEKSDSEAEHIAREMKLPEGAVDYINSPVLPTSNGPSARQLDESLEEYARRRYMEEYEDETDPTYEVAPTQTKWDETRETKQKSQSKLTDADEKPSRGRHRDLNDRGRGRTVETQSGGLAMLRAAWNWKVWFS